MTKPQAALLSYGKAKLITIHFINKGLSMIHANESKRMATITIAMLSFAISFQSLQPSSLAVPMSTLQEQTNPGDGQQNEIRPYATVKKEWDSLSVQITKLMTLRRRTSSARDEKQFAKWQNEAVEKQRALVNEYGEATLKEFIALQQQIAADKEKANSSEEENKTAVEVDNKNNKDQSAGNDNTDDKTNEENKSETQAEPDPVAEKLAELCGNMNGLVSFYIGQDQPWKAMKFVKEFVKHDNVDPRLYDAGAFAAFAANEFEIAKLAVDKAEESGGLRQSAGIKEVINEEIEKWNKEKELRAIEAEKNDLPRVKLATSAGDIVLELYENEAPETVGNFVSLVESGFYDGLTFHRVLKNFMAQGGCPEGTGRAGPGYKIYCECDKEDARMHFAGTISMAKTMEKNTGGSQFFVTFRPTPHLDGLHTVFGRVVEGMDVVSEIQKVSPGQTTVEKSVIEKATVLRKRDHEYKPNKVGEDNGDSDK